MALRYVKLERYLENQRNSSHMKEQIKKRYESILCLMKPHGPITGRAMFGGYGFYFDKIIFGILVRETLYFRIGQINEKDFKPYKSEPFVYEGKNRPIVMSYLTLPDKVLHNPKLLPKWIEKARDASLQSRAKRKHLK
jgi:DNA transformation protein and related proteins